MESSHDFSDPGSPKRRFLGRRKPLSRKKKIGAVVALAAAVGTGGLLQPVMASAATIDTVWIPVSAQDAHTWSVGWTPAWNECRRKHPETHSVQPNSVEYVPGGGYYQKWDCSDSK